MADAVMSIEGVLVTHLVSVQLTEEDALTAAARSRPLEVETVEGT